MKRTEQVNSIATQSNKLLKKKSATLTRADVNLIVNRKFAQTFFDATFSAGTAAGQFQAPDMLYCRRSTQALVSCGVYHPTP